MSAVSIEIEIGPCDPVIPKTAVVNIRYADTARRITWTYERSLVTTGTYDHYAVVTEQHDDDGNSATVNNGHVQVLRDSATEDRRRGHGYTPDARPLQRAVANKIDRVLCTVLAVHESHERVSQ